MAIQIVLRKAMDFAAIARDAEAGRAPRHVLGMLAAKLGAEVHSPPPGRPSVLDRVGSRINFRAENWMMARSLKGRFAAGDVLYCDGEETALPIAAHSGSRRNRPRLISFVHNLNRPKGRLLLKLIGAREKVDLFVTNVRGQAEFLRDYLKLPESRVVLLEEQTDIRFFSPGPQSPGKTRPVVASVGLEQRDYRTLAAATEDLDVDVRISGASPDAAAQARAFPDPMPGNMTRRFYQWPDLVQLYRDADVVAISLFPCNYSAGITTLMEGMSCRRPVVVTGTAGLAEYLAPGDSEVVEPGDAAAIRRAIAGLLGDRAKAEALADRGLESARRRHDSDRYTERLAGIITSL